MIVLRRVTPDHAMILKSVRLRALADAPHAFGSTYAKESELSDAEWVKRAAQWSGGSSVLFLAFEGDEVCGIAGSYLDPQDATRAQLISMWTAPACRRKGIGRRLVNKVITWARRRGAQTLQLWVTSHNHSAILFYQQLKFKKTGRIQPYPNHPSVMEYEMSLPVAARDGGDAGSSNF